MDKSIYGQCSVCNTYIQLESKVNTSFCPECKKTRKIGVTMEMSNAGAGLIEKLQVQAQIKRQYGLLSDGSLPKGCDVDEVTCEKALDNLDLAISIGEKLIGNEYMDKITKIKAEERLYSAHAERAYVLARLNRRDEAKEDAEIAKSHLKAPKGWLDDLLRTLTEEEY